MRPTITMKLLAAALLAATPLASQADGLRIPFTGSLEGGGRVVVARPSRGVRVHSRLLGARSRGRAGSRNRAPRVPRPCSGWSTISSRTASLPPRPKRNDGDQVVLPFENGRFRFTDTTKERYIEGEYHGYAAPTVASKPPPAGSPAGTPPTGTWIIEGQVCISGGSPQLFIANDCAAKRYFPGARRHRPVERHRHDLHQPNDRDSLVGGERFQRQTISPDLCSQRSGMPFARQ